MSEVGVLTAALAGLLSFLSPCVLPLIPAYLSFVSGYGLADIRSGAARSVLFKRSLAFAAGFTLVFTALGLLFSGASMLLGGLARTLTTIAGAIVVLLGLNLVFDFIKLLDLEARFHASSVPRGYLGAFLIGISFAAGWSPCVGPILASILLYASGEGSALRSIALLAAYSIGLAVPFLAAGLFFDRLSPLMAWFKRHARGVRITSGLLLVALGATMALGRLVAVSSAAVRMGSALAAAAEMRPVPARFMAFALWLLAAALVLIVPALRKRKVAEPARLVVASLLAALAIGEAVGLWSTASVVASWLLFQGA